MTDETIMYSKGYAQAKADLAGDSPYTPYSMDDIAYMLKGCCAEGNLNDAAWYTGYKAGLLETK